MNVNAFRKIYIAFLVGAFLVGAFFVFYDIGALKEFIFGIDLDPKEHPVLYKILNASAVLMVFLYLPLLIMSGIATYGSNRIIAVDFLMPFIVVLTVVITRLGFAS